MTHRKATGTGRPGSIKKYFAALVLSFSLISFAPPSAQAADEVEHYDARVQSYPTNVELKSSGAGLTWMLLFVMLAICMGTIFKDAKRSHLD